MTPSPPTPRAPAPSPRPGTFSDFVSSAITITDLTASGGGDEQAFVIDTGGNSGRIVIDYDFYFVPDQLRVYYPPRAQGGALIFDSGVISGGGTFNVNYGPGTSTFVEIVMNEGGQDPGTVWDLFNVTIIPTVAPGGNGLLKMGSRLLSLQGDGTFTGDVAVQSGTLRVQHDSALGRNSSGTAADPTTQTYLPTKTTVEPGGTLQIDSSIPQNSGGFAAGVQIWDERLVLNGAAQQVQVSGSSGTFTLTFNGQTTAALNFNVTAAQMQAALNALGNVNGAATVTKKGSIYTVTFGGSLAGPEQRPHDRDDERRARQRHRSDLGLELPLSRPRRGQPVARSDHAHHEHDHRRCRRLAAHPLRPDRRRDQPHRGRFQPDRGSAGLREHRRTRARRARTPIAAIPRSTRAS